MSQLCPWWWGGKGLRAQKSKIEQSWGPLPPVSQFLSSVSGVMNTSHFAGLGVSTSDTESKLPKLDWARDAGRAVPSTVGCARGQPLPQP